MVGRCAKPKEGDQTIWHSITFLFNNVLPAECYLILEANTIVFFF
jgi:hypothetical protein